MTALELLRRLDAEATGGRWVDAGDDDVANEAGERVFQTGCGCCTSGGFGSDGDLPCITTTRNLLPLLARLVGACEKAMGPTSSTANGNPGFWIDHLFVRADHVPSLVALRDALSELNTAAAKEAT